MELSTTTYTTLYGLLRDALLVKSDATPLLTKAADELAQLSVNGLPIALQQDSTKLEALQQAGFACGQDEDDSVCQVAARPVACA